MPFHRKVPWIRGRLVDFRYVLCLGYLSLTRQGAKIEWTCHSFEVYIFIILSTNTCTQEYLNGIGLTSGEKEELEVIIMLELDVDV